MAELERVERGGAAIWVSPALRREGFVHGFSTRRGGVSEAPFDSLNLSRGMMLSAEERDSAARVAENHARFLAAIGASGATVRSARQVHGAGVLDVDGAAAPECEAPAAPACDDPAADAIIAATSPDLILIRTADCVPILLASPRHGAVAAVHAGWRGLVAGVIEAAITALRQRGIAASELVAAIGPAIGGGAYEVGEEVAAAFTSRGLSESIRNNSIRNGRARPHVDPAHAASTILRREGVPAEQIDRSDLCTFSQADDFFSYRRDGARSGRLGAAVRSRGPA